MATSFDFNVAAIVALGILGAGIFWNNINHIYKKICHVEDKIDHIAESMVTKEGFDSHRHMEDGSLVVVRRKPNEVHKTTEEVSQGRYIRLPSKSGKKLG